MNAHSRFDAATVALLPSPARFSLRIAPADLGRASAAFGVTIPERIGQGAHAGDRAAYCLGPDEWLLHAPEDAQGDIVAAFDNLRAETPVSLTVISDREVTLGITGPAAAELLSVGCPIDLRRLAPGCAKRTLFDSAQVVLIRDAEDAFRMEVWRSFLPHVQGLLDIALTEFASGY